MESADPNLGMREHYARHLAPLYTWMVGDVDAALDRTRTLLKRHGFSAVPGAFAVDLGCGFGLQAIPLSEAGYEVLALDLSAELLAELERRRGSLPIRGIQADLREFPVWAGRTADLIVCMGDTLTHLPDLKSVEDLLGQIASGLRPEGRTVLTFRDYCSAELQGVHRFIPVRSDADRILTCCLDYQSDRVEVTDLVHERAGDAWKQRASRYWKVRLDRDWVAIVLVKGGLLIEENSVERGMVTLIARLKK